MFFKVKTAEEVLEIIAGFEPLAGEIVSLADALGRTLTTDIVAPEDLPGFHRSTMDGYAVRAQDTFGATESLPALLELAGEVLMRQTPKTAVGAGQAVKISTGGMLPAGADGVVMVEYCHPLDSKTIEVSRAISPLENVIRPDDDFKQGARVLSGGEPLRPQDLGVLAGLGLAEVSVYRRPKVAIISTGDEVIPIDERPEPGQVRDINTYTLGAFCRQAGAETVILGLCGDDFEQLREGVSRGLRVADTVWISGGSSVGTRDLTVKVFESFEDTEILVHGISISPGKPTIIAKAGSQALFGLPGHVASALVVAEVFLGPFLARLAGEKTLVSRLYEVIEAELGRNVESTSGREDYIRVSLKRKGDGYLAEPIFGKSGLISTLVEAEGLLRVEMNTEGLYKGQRVAIMAFRPLKGDIVEA